MQDLSNQYNNKKPFMYGYSFKLINSYKKFRNPIKVSFSSLDFSVINQRCVKQYVWLGILNQGMNCISHNAVVIINH